MRFSTGLAAESYETALGTLKTDLSRAQPDFRHLDRILEWSEDAGAQNYPSCKNILLDALLSPWAGNAQLPAERKAQISAFIIRLFEDPRVKRRYWNDAPELAARIMKRWLTQVALEQFVKILDITAVERQWQYRSAFWMAYFNRGYVEEAWVLFGPRAWHEARRAFGKDVSFGKLRAGGGVMEDHSVLLLRIGGLVVADWSHNGTCRGWLSGDERAPKLYQLDAPRSDLVRTSPLSQAHYYPERGTWQKAVASFIAEHTGIRMMQRDYMP